MSNNGRSDFFFSQPNYEVDFPDDLQYYSIFFFLVLTASKREVAGVIIIVRGDMGG